MYAPDRERFLMGIDAVIDKDLASAVLARELGAEVLVMATDADAVYLDFATPDARAIRRASPDRLAEHHFAAGSMGPKVQAACEVAAAGGRAAIGALDDLAAMVAGTGGTQVVAGPDVFELRDPAGTA